MITWDWINETVSKSIEPQIANFWVGSGAIQTVAYQDGLVLTSHPIRTDDGYTVQAAAKHDSNKKVEYLYIWHKSNGNTVYRADLVNKKLFACKQFVDVRDTLPTHETKRYDDRDLRELEAIAIHHTAVSGNISPNAIASYHVDTNGWPGIGYTFYIDDKGIIYRCHDLDRKSYAVRNKNHIALSIAFGGNFENSEPTQEQIESGVYLVAWIRSILGDTLPIKCHCDFDDNDTVCPGKHGKKLVHLLEGTE